METEKQLLFIDAYDSFTENIAALLQQLLRVRITTIHIDSKIFTNPIDGSTLLQDTFDEYIQHFDAVVVGPGPGNPQNPSDIGIISHLWGTAARLKKAVLGICLGFQSLGLAYGASISRLSEPCHGHAKEIIHSDDDIFSGVGHVIATNYHSLEIKLGPQPLLEVSRPSSVLSFRSDSSTDTLASANSIFSQASFRPSLTCPKLQPLAWDANGTLMAIRHSSLPFWGLQFHPESCKSNLACHKILQNWWIAAMEISRRARQLLPAHSPRPSVSCNNSSTLYCDTSPASSACVDAKALREELYRLTQSSCAKVQSGVINIDSITESLSKYCHDISLNGATAMLESTKKGQYSIYAIPSASTWRLEFSRGEDFCTLYEQESKTSWKLGASDVFDHLQDLMSARRAHSGSSQSPFWGGFMGYFSYEMGLDSLQVPGSDQRPQYRTPDVSLVWVDRSIVVDKLEHTVSVQSILNDDSAWISSAITALTTLQSNPAEATTTRSPEAEIENVLQKTEPFLSGLMALPNQPLNPSYLDRSLIEARFQIPSESEYKKNILACQSFLRAGDSYELCLTAEARVTIPSRTPSYLLYQNLCLHNPVPFAAYLRLGSTTILSSSPEQFLTWDRIGTMDMVPMKGTVKKTTDMTFAKASHILSSPKESAENLMIADLIRHDLYSTVGRDQHVDVVKLCEVVEHETVFQLVSHIRAKAPIPETASEEQKQKEVMHYGFKALKQTMPPGSMTGAPKKSSCDILSRLERRRRAVYSGVLGYMDVGGGGSFSVCIRTAFANDDETKNGTQTWRIGAGGAITVLSDVDAEWDEMKTKLDSVLRAFRPNACN